MKTEKLEETCERWQRLLIEFTTDPPREFDLVQLWALTPEQHNKSVQQQNLPSEVTESEDFTKEKEIRTDLLRAVGSCKTIEKLLIRDASFGRYGAGLNVLAPIEWELFFSKLQSNPVLRSVVIEGSASFYKTVIPHFTTYLAASASLENLRIGELLREINIIPKRRIRRLEEETVKKLADALVQSKTLEFLQIGSVEVASIHILLKAVTGYPRNQSIRVLEIDEYVGWLGYALPSLLACEHSTLREIRLNVLTCTELDAEQCSAIGCSLQQATSLERFTLITDLRSTFDLKPTYSVQNAIDVMEELVRSSRESPLLKFDICILRDYMDTHLSSWLVKALSRYSNVDRLQFRTLKAGAFEIHELLPIFQALKSNFFLQSLSVKNISGLGAWKQLTECLQSNTTLKRLFYEGSLDLDDTSFKSLMELLQVNIYLEEIDFGNSSWTSDGRFALVKEALKRNRTLRSNLETLGNAGLALTGPKSGRLFLCGSPNAGKTRLRMSMMKLTRSKKSWLRKVVAGSMKKTKGIEVEMLRDDDEMQVSVWDLAGQWIFHALQDLIFPRASQTCIFVFVFSPLDDSGEKVKTDLAQALRSELTSWLRFIASNSPVTGHCLPHVLVVVTHKDKMDNQESGWAKFIVNDLQEKFEGVLSVHGGDELYCVDAQVTKEVQPLSDHILRIFEGSLQQGSPSVPWACSQLSSKLAKRPMEVINCPVWHIDTLFSFFSQEMKVLQAGSLDLRVKGDRKVLEAMALYLHDVGSIVLVPESEMVVVDVNWLTDKFLGRLICQGHNSHVKDGSAHLSPDGFVAQYELQDILLKLWTKHRRQGITFDVRILEELLVKMDLCYHVTGKKGDGRYFIPSLFGKDETKQRPAQVAQFALEWTTSNPSDWGHFGFRLQSQDKERSSLTPAVFPRFQIHLRNKMKSIGLDVVQENFDCAHDYNKLHVNGYYIILERGGHLGDHVDILVRFSKLKPREKAAAIAFIKENLVEEFKSYCASPKGSPGVALVVAIMRPESVKKLTPHLHRIANQVVLVQDLKKQFIEDVETKLQTTELDGQQWGDDNFLLDYQHAWPRVPHPQAGLPNQSQLAIELLERTDVEDVVKAVRMRREDRLQDLRTVMDNVDASMGEGIVSFSVSLKGEKEIVVQLQAPANPPKEDVPMPAEDGNDRDGVDLSLSERDAELVNLIISQVDRKCGSEDGGFSSVQDQDHGIRKDLAKIISIERELRSNLIHIMTRVDRMIGYTDALKKAKMPRRPFLTLDDMGFGKRLGGAVQFGTPVRLHLMCESQSGPHIIERQPGWGVCVTKENKEWLRLISANSLRVAWYLMRSGVQLLHPSQNPVPGPVKETEFAELGIGSKGALTVTDITLESLKARDKMPLAPGDEMTSEAWTFLKNCMAAKLDYAHDFKLHLVKYRARTGAVNESHAWLCQNCMTRGQRHGILSSVGEQDGLAG